jgi:hypothetical protein
MRRSIRQQTASRGVARLQPHSACLARTHGSAHACQVGVAPGSARHRNPSPCEPFDPSAGREETRGEPAAAIRMPHCLARTDRPTHAKLTWHLARLGIGTVARGLTREKHLWSLCKMRLFLSEFGQVDVGDVSSATFQVGWTLVVLLFLLLFYVICNTT